MPWSGGSRKIRENRKSRKTSKGDSPWLEQSDMVI